MELKIPNQRLATVGERAEGRVFSRVVVGHIAVESGQDCDPRDESDDDED